jgi:branched-chain amino acid transport system ATP-binding protein
VIEIREVTRRYGGLLALDGVSFDVGSGEMVGLLGANGAGKSTLIRSILGLMPARQGRILWGGRDLAGAKTHAIVASGISCIPEGRKVFPRMTVAENLALGAFLEPSGAVVRERLGRVYEIFPRLKERASQLAGTMSGGEQAMVSIGRGLMAEPRLLVIDEPSLGLSPLYVKENFNVIRRINELGMTVLLVEQNARQTLAIAHYGYVLSQGRVVAEGNARDLAGNDDVRSAYFG